MAVAKRQGRSEDQSEDFRQNKQNKLLAKPNLHRAGPGGGKRRIKGGAKELSHSLSLPRVYALSLFLPPLRASPLSSLPSLWVGMPSHFEDGFSCYLLNKIEL